MGILSHNLRPQHQWPLRSALQPLPNQEHLQVQRSGLGYTNQHQVLQNLAYQRLAMVTRRETLMHQWVRLKPIVLQLKQSQ